MEVHHHPDLHHKKKKFKEYFFEFLMIFLAVTMGFMAENLREHISDQNKGKEYVKSFIEDLQSDTAQYNQLIKLFTIKDSVLSTSGDYFNSLFDKSKSKTGLSAIVRHSCGFSDFVYTDRTIQQIKNSGGLRLIQNRQIADSIILYDEMVRVDLIHQDGMEKYQQETINAHISMIGYKQFGLIYSSTPLNIIPEAVLLTKDTRELNSYFNRIAVFRSNCRAQLGRLGRLRSTATRLITFLKREEE